MTDEVLAALNIDERGIYVDGTYGRGGHSRAILERLGAQGRLLAFDRDPDAIAHARLHAGSDSRFSIHHASFGEIMSITAQTGLTGRIDGVLLDLGVSSPQLDTAERGFSFMRSGPLDMRFDPQSGISASDWLMQVDEDDLTRILREYGEEKFARRIAKAIVAARDVEPIRTTARLAEIVADAVPGYERGQHPATRTFQAIRIYINQELEALEQCLASMPQVLKPGGRLTVLSFHSLEDRIVKQRMRGDVAQATELRRLPVRDADVSRHPLRPISKPRHASEREVAENRRARSAILRVAERL